MPAELHTLGGGRWRAHRGWCGCNRPCGTTSSNQTRQSSGARDVEDAASYGGRETKAAAYDTAGAVPSRLPMVRGLRPRDMMRGAVVGGGRAVSNVGAVGQAGRLRLTYPGNPATTVHRGRCTLRASAKPTLRHTTQRVRKTTPKLPAHLTAPLKPASRTPRRGRRPRRPFRWMTDGVITMRKRSPRAVGRTVPGAPPSVDRHRRFRAHTSPLAP